MDKLVDFSQPLVAEHADGSVEPAEAAWRRSDGCWQVKWYRNGNPCIGGFTSEGNPLAPWDWRIRNTAKPSTLFNEELTQRMERAIRRHVAGETDLYGDRRGPNITVEAEFRSIVSDLPKPVDPIDPDLIEARQVAQADVPAGSNVYYLDGSQDDYPLMRCTLAAIKRGRTLAAGGTAHGA